MAGAPRERTQDQVSQDDEPAENRLDFAEDRTVLAHERSFASWVRTGLAAIGIGLGFRALFHTLEPDWVPKTIASSFMLVAIIIFILATRRAMAVRQRLEPHRASALQPVRLRLLATALVITTGALLVAIWLLI
ncbi:MAG: DUF202 domain-containing protein [Alphaproteobacteria bacterium]|nr:DUF202 domain-containing protein [Alphaproteobacteria bacterium]MBU0793716.1 DUF202 domain-containing protein [Alphaproteobacteria bacterium]MBU0876440.1 DUF202 domain-containing protein [Alphaproteobacteria bacterium]MBU1769459.1 DUF202 domain-containing protein [Alphaproteobacteria bacterium]